jgi:hypothetical protein
MTDTIQGVWDKFERWSKRYEKVGQKIIDEMFYQGTSDSNAALFICKSEEIDLDLTIEMNIEQDELIDRINRKIAFLRGYLVNISFDGAEFMTKNSGFLACQYPSKCSNAIGVWLEQDLEGDPRPGSHFGFQDFDVSFFSNTLEDVDFASMWSILPFDRMFIRRPKGVNWDKRSVKEVVEIIRSDLRFDYAVKMKVDSGVNRNLLCISVNIDG